MVDATLFTQTLGGIIRDLQIRRRNGPYDLPELVFGLSLYLQDLRDRLDEMDRSDRSRQATHAETVTLDPHEPPIDHGQVAALNSELDSAIERAVAAEVDCRVLAETRSELAALRANVDKMEGELKAAKSARNFASHDREQAEQDAESSAMVADRMNREITKLKAELRAVRCSRDVASNAQMHRALCEALGSDPSEVTWDVAIASVGLNAHELARIGVETERLRSQVRDSNQLRADLVDEMAAHRETKGLHAFELSERAALVEKNDRAVSQLDRIAEELVKIRAEHKANQELIKLLRCERDTAEEERDDAESESVGLTTRLGGFSRMVADSICADVEEIGWGDTKSQGWALALGNVKSDRAELASLRAHLRSANAENDVIRESLVRSRDKEETLEDERDRLRVELQVAQSQARNDRLLLKLAEGQNDQFEEERDVADGLAITLGGDVASLNREVSRLRSELEDIRSNPFKFLHDLGYRAGDAIVRIAASSPRENQEDCIRDRVNFALNQTRTSVTHERVSAVIEAMLGCSLLGDTYKPTKDAAGGPSGNAMAAQINADLIRGALCPVLGEALPSDLAPSMLAGRAAQKIARLEEENRRRRDAIRSSGLYVKTTDPACEESREGAVAMIAGDQENSGVVPPANAAAEVRINEVLVQGARGLQTLLGEAEKP